jgi:4'-phosphopantetheinyl transferase
VRFYKPYEIEKKIEDGVPRLYPNVVHIWSLQLECSDGEFTKYSQILSQDERERADRFVFKKNNREFTLAKASLRQILSYYTDVLPTSIEFTISKTGKPQLQTSIENKSSINFNLSHSNGRALIAISDGSPVGIDLEMLRYDDDIEGIADNFFFGTEQKCIANTPPPLQHETFFRFWVAKEAVLKGEGLGLSFPLNQFEVEFGCSQEVAKVVSCDTKQLSNDWVVHMLPQSNSWLGALATQNAETTIVYI